MDIFDVPGDLVFSGAGPGPWEAVDGSLVLDARPSLSASMAPSVDPMEKIREAMRIAAGR